MSIFLPTRRPFWGPSWTRNPLWSRARAVPSLDLRFAENKSLTDATTGQNLVTFTRASSGTYVDSTGTIRTATTNLLLRSEEFNDAAWSKVAATVTADAISSPSGQQNADKLVETTAASTGHYVNPSPSPSITSGQSYTFSVFAKAAERTFLQLILTGIGSGGANIVAGFDLSTGTAGTPSSGSSSITALGGGWYRCSLSVTASTTASTLAQIRLSQNSSSSPSSYTGDGTSGIYLWGAQLEQSSTVGEYIPTTSTINSAPRFDHNPTTGESLGLLVEEQRTNLQPNSNDLTSNTWESANVTVAVSGTGPDNQNAYEISENTASSTHNQTARGGTSSNSTSVTSGTSYAGSVFLKRSSVDWVQLTFGGNGFSNRFANFNLATGAIGTASNVTASIVAYPNGWYRCSISGTASSTASTNNLIVAFTDNTDSASRLPSYTGATANKVLAALAQFETGAFPTSYIPTSTAAATRSADVASITGTNFSSWYRQDEGTVFANAISYIGAAAVSRGVLSIDGASANDAHRLFRQSDLQPVMQTLVSGVAQSTFGFGAIWSTSTPQKMAYAYATNNFAGTVNNATVQTDSSGTVPTTSTLNIGNLSAGSHFGGTIRRITYWPARLSNTTLQQITQ